MTSYSVFISTVINVIFLSIYFNNVVTQEVSCYGGYTAFQADCYGFVHKPETWFDAQSACRSLGGYLAEPQSVHEMNFIKSLANATQGNVALWLGGEDLLKEGQWFWATSLKMVNAYTDWRAGEPNNQQGENCMEVDLDGHWNDDNCDHKNAFVCQKTGEDDIIG